MTDPIHVDLFSRILRERHSGLAADETGLQDVARQLAYDWERSGQARDGFEGVASATSFADSRVQSLARSRGIFRLLAPAGPLAPHESSKAIPV